MRFTNISLALLAVAMWAFVSESDYQAAKASEKAYCERLADGAHSDYLQIRSACDGDG